MGPWVNQSSPAGVGGYDKGVTGRWQEVVGVAGARLARHRVTWQAAPPLLPGWQAGLLLRRASVESGKLAGTMGQSEFAQREGCCGMGALGTGRGRLR